MFTFLRHNYEILTSNLWSMESIKWDCRSALRDITSHLSQTVKQADIMRFVLTSLWHHRLLSVQQKWAPIQNTFSLLVTFIPVHLWEQDFPLMESCAERIFSQSISCSTANLIIYQAKIAKHSVVHESKAGSRGTVLGPQTIKGPKKPPGVSLIRSKFIYTHWSPLLTTMDPALLANYVALPYISKI